MTRILNLQALDARPTDSLKFSTVSLGACGSTISLVPGLCLRPAE